ncbi:CDP-diacylglycerol diphosphatase [Beijerinckia sp. L45]|uniref:CDP-diacylglycerol diphosphatase n=1 Tax=Beijerinckia sp. L45 TaxID=1641855 RepID=UPI00131CE010|nr:CDP-diacylglycerol diphosphatase [Beijerinckia sp. L45]
MSLATATAVFLSVASYAVAQSADRGLLWKVVQACVLNARLTGSSFPCLDVNIAKGVESGFAVVRAPLETTHIVVTPTARVEGVEHAGLQAAGTENYFADAWQARHFVAERAPKPLRRDDIGLALNSRPGRSQDQLHIHIDCMQVSARDALKAHEAEIHTGVWSRLSFDLHGDRYWATKLKSPDLRDVNVFQLVADGMHVTEADRSKVTIVAAGASFDKGDDGFYLLALIAKNPRSNQGHGEFLLDHSCAAE